MSGWRSLHNIIRRFLAKLVPLGLQLSLLPGKLCCHSLCLNMLVLIGCVSADYQTSKQTNKQTNKQTFKQTNKQTNTQNKQTKNKTTKETQKQIKKTN
jgi:hypothetical protein